MVLTSALWPSILRAKPNFLDRFISPIVALRPKIPPKIPRKSPEKIGKSPKKIGDSRGAPLAFFTLREFRDWAEKDPELIKKYHVKYLKGLGSSTNLVRKIKNLKNQKLKIKKNQ
jgi:hypothetical protein